MTSWLCAGPLQPGVYARHGRELTGCKSRRVGARRVASPGQGPIRHRPFGVLQRSSVRFLTPLSEPGVRLLPHWALQRSAFRLQDYSWICYSRSISQLHLAERPNFIRLAITFLLENR